MLEPRPRATWLLGIVALAGCGKSSSTSFATDPGPSNASDDGGGSADDRPPASSSPDAGSSFGDPPTPDAGANGNESGACSFGSAASIATSDNLNLFGQIIYYEDGGVFPAGRYRATYTDGCMKYDYIFAWTVQAGTPDAGSGFWLVSKDAKDLVAKPPGSTMGYSTFDECVAGNKATDPPVEFDFDGGPLGVWLDDNPYLDNVAGDNGRNPAWTLVYLQPCPPNLGTPVPK